MTLWQPTGSNMMPWRIETLLMKVVQLHKYIFWIMQVSILNLFKIPLKIKIKHLIETTMKALSKMSLLAVVNLKRRLMKLHNPNHRKLVPMLSLMLSKMSLLAVINLTRRLMKLFNLNHSKLVPIMRLMLMIKVPNQITIAKIQTPATLMILLEEMMK